MSSEMRGSRQPLKAKSGLPQSCDDDRQQNSDCDPGAELLDPGTTQHRLQTLYDEIHAIHLLDRKYWQHGDEAGSPERVSYQSRQKRLQEIRSEIARLKTNRT
jgi:hypothetical protein